MCRLELLHVDQLVEPPATPVTSTLDEEDDETSVQHRDEEQVLLDTRRAFVTYPKGKQSVCVGF